MAIAVARNTSRSCILEMSPETGAYQAFLKQSLKDLSALGSFSSDRHFAAEGGWNCGFSKLDWLSSTQDPGWRVFYQGKYEKIKLLLLWAEHILLASEQTQGLK